jgi:hypothetical protein
MELYLRAMCEGFVDDQTTGDNACNLTTGDALYDYTFENLCFQAFNGRWLSMLPESVRADKPQGFGPIPNTRLYAQTYNQFAQCLNLLTRARIMLPHKLQQRFRVYQNSEVRVPQWFVSTNKFIGFGISPPAATTLTQENEWEDAFTDGVTGKQSIVSTSFADYGEFDPSDQPMVVTQRSTTQWLYSLTDSMAIHALPPTIQDMYETLGGGWVGWQDVLTSTGYATQVATQGESSGCVGTPNYFWDGSIGYEVGEPSETVYTCRLMEPSGLLNVGTPPPADYSFGWPGLTACTTGSAISTGVLLQSNSSGFISIPLVAFDD